MNNDFEIFRRQSNSCEHPVAHQKVQLSKTSLTQFLLAWGAEVKSGLLWKRG